MTHGRNVQTFVEYCDQNSDRQVTSAKKYMNYTAFGAATIYGKSIRLTHGGTTFHLKDNAAEEHMKLRLANNDNAAYAIKAIENAMFDKKFKRFIDDVQRDKDFRSLLSDEQRRELTALFF